MTVFAKIQNKDLGDELTKKINHPNLELNNIPKSLLRNSSFLEFETFKSYHTETELMRYIKKLEKRFIINIFNDTTGSCTMKLNAAVQLLPLSWSEFSNMHPFAP